MSPLEREVIRQSKMFLLIRVVLAQGIILLLAVLLTLVLQGLSARRDWVLTAYLALLLLDVLLVAYVYVSWLSITYVIEPGFVIVRQGILGVKEKIYKADGISAVRVIQSLVGRACNYGTIEFEYPPDQTISLINVDTPHAYERLIKNGAGSG